MVINKYKRYFQVSLISRGVVTADGSACLIWHSFYADTTPPFIWVCDPTEVEFVSPLEIEPGLTTEAPIKSKRKTNKQPFFFHLCHLGVCLIVIKYIYTI